MAKVVGIGGVFFKARDPKALGEWYAKHLGFDVTKWGGAKFEGSGTGVWTPFAADTTHFAPSTKDFMVNYRVDDLDALLAKLRADGVEVLDRGEDGGPFGKFGYIVDPEGNLLELWQPMS